MNNITAALTQKLIQIGAKCVSRGRHATFHIASPAGWVVALGTTSCSAIQLPTRRRWTARGLARLWPPHR